MWNIHWNLMSVMVPLRKLSSGSFLFAKTKEIQNLFAPFAFTFTFLLCMEMQCLLLFHAGTHLAYCYGWTEVLCRERLFFFLDLVAPLLSAPRFSGCMLDQALTLNLFKHT